MALLVEQCLAPVPGGTGRYSRELALALAATAPAGAALTGWTAWHRNLTAARLPGTAGPRRLPLGRRALAAAWERGVGPTPRGADLVHAPTLLAPPRRRRPLVVTVHDTVPWTFPATLTRRGVAFHLRMGARVARYADLVVVPSEAVRREVVATLAPTGPVLVVAPGVPVELRLPSDAGGRAARLGLPAGGHLVAVSTLEPRKGLDVALTALAEPAAPDLPLLLVGRPGWGGVDPVGLAARLGVADRVRVLGPLDDADLAVVLATATALVAPSRAEGFGLPVLEAMALGTPAVTSDVPALVELGGAATVQVPVGDPAALAAALARVAADPGHRSALVAAGRARAAGYSWTAAARRLWTAYAGLCGLRVETSGAA